MIPQDAVEEIAEFWDNSTKKFAFYYVNSEKIGYRYWDEDGQLLMQYDIKEGKMHGSFQTWHDNGILQEDAQYIEGKEHGITKQYDYDGNLIGTYEMNHGTGADLWYSEKGLLAEERYCKNGDRDGYERWWNGNNETIFIEQHFKEGSEHGIFREWNQQGRLRRGFPKYFVNGQKVTKRQYLKACEQDESLPKFVVAENEPQRSLPRDLMDNAN
jgi:antitoxin component YwqK of YwqJK toxin-antitoxin module